MTSNPTELRTQLVARGYHVIPNVAKMPAVKGWNTPDFIARELFGPRADLTRWELRWPGAHTIGVRLDEMVVIDADIDDPLVATFMEAVQHFAPEIYATAPVRFGASPYKRAIFCRLADGEEPFRRLASHKYGEDGHCVEIFGGGRLKGDKCSRQFGIYGPHSYNADGSVAAEYSWDTDVMPLHEVNHADLPRITRAQCAAIVDAFDDIAAGSGWQRQAAGVPDPVAGTQRVYDIDEEATRFDLQGGEQVGYEDLVEGMRCSSSFWDGLPHQNRSKCHVGWSPLHECLMVYDYEAEAAHYPKQYAPDFEPERLREQIVSIGARDDTVEPTPPADDAGLDEKAAWLIQTRAYCEAEDKVVSLYATQLACHTTPTAFERRYQSWFQGHGRKRVKATDLWANSPSRVHVDGVRMRPDQPFPLFTELGATFKNSYRRPIHPAGTNVTPFDTFMKRFIPEPAEREWLLDWMAHKQAKPWIPGTAVVFVADAEEGTRVGTFGTGRGLMGRIARKLYGEQYARSQSFAIVSGTSGQSDFNDWLHGSVLVTIDEAQTSPTAYRRGERNATYEILKELVDPAPKLHRFNGKNRQAFDGMSYASVWIATNHANAAAIPENDRRFTVLRNGRSITPEEAEEIAGWMADPTNIGALSRMLAARDLTGFNMMVPLVTAGKTEMAELARSDVEEILRDIMEDDSRGKVFAKAHIEAVVEHHFSGQGAHWRGELAGCWHTYCVGLKTPAGNPIRVRMLGTRRKLFCFRDHLRQIRAMPEAAIQREVRKWGSVDPMPGPAEAIGPREENE